MSDGNMTQNAAAWERRATPAQSEPGRRVFFMKVLAGSAVLASRTAAAGTAAKLDPNDAYVKSMGFRLNTADVDQVKFPRHTTEQHCSACQLWSGGDADFGECSFFDHQLTPKNGWCKNFKVRKAA